MPVHDLILQEPKYHTMKQLRLINQSIHQLINQLCYKTKLTEQINKQDYHQKLAESRIRTLSSSRVPSLLPGRPAKLLRCALAASH